MQHAASTIVALSTAPGVGAIAVIRLSGPGAIRITDEIFEGKKLAEQPANTVHFGRIVESKKSKVESQKSEEGTQEIKDERQKTKDVGAVANQALATSFNSAQEESDKSQITNRKSQITPDGSQITSLDMGQDENSASQIPADKSQITNRKSQIIDEVVVTIFRAPHSYTGEDVCEISCHGSPYILQQVMALCVRQGAILAAPGEFTQRAFLHGKMDLTQAEAVADLIASESAAGHRTAINQLRGGFSSALKAMREELIHFAALIELEIDFGEEDVAFADRTQLRHLLKRINGSTAQLITSFSLGNAIKKGISVAIIGPPNAGKSTLLNALLNEDRAIVSDIAGTTRDTIEETININGILFRFIDTAGIREKASDAIEAQGIARSRKKASEADVVLTLVDGSLLTAESRGPGYTTAPPWRKGPATQRFIDVVNKADCIGEDIRLHISMEYADAMFISARNGDGVENLKQEIYGSSVRADINPDAVIITNARHHAALLKIREATEDIRQGLDSLLSGDLLSHHIRQALHYIGELTGDVQHDRDILGTIFGKFCIGK